MVITETVVKVMESSLHSILYIRIEKLANLPNIKNNYGLITCSADIPVVPKS